MKILLLGKDGQVGWELQRSLAPLGEVHAFNRTAGADLADPQALCGLVRSLAPQLIVNAAAYTAVDKAESDAETAQVVNAVAPGVLAQEATRLGALLLHFSTDYVFDGSGQSPWRETDNPAPLSVYGRTKLEGERAIEASQGRHLIFRTSWVYASRGANFAKTMLRLAGERERLQVVDDQIGAPTGADLLADIAAHAVRAGLASGIYHVAAAGQTSWHGYARHVIEWVRARGEPVKVAPERITPVPSAQYPTAARRPLNSRLDTGKIERALGLRMPPWQHGVERMLTETLGL